MWWPKRLIPGLRAVFPGKSPDGDVTPAKPSAAAASHLERCWVWHGDHHPSSSTFDG